MSRLRQCKSEIKKGVFVRLLSQQVVGSMQKVVEFKNCSPLNFDASIDPTEDVLQWEQDSKSKEQLTKIDFKQLYGLVCLLDSRQVSSVVGKDWKRISVFLGCETMQPYYYIEEPDFVARFESLPDVADYELAFQRFGAVAMAACLLEPVSKHALQHSDDDKDSKRARKIATKN